MNVFYRPNEISPNSLGGTTQLIESGALVDEIQEVYNTAGYSQMTRVWKHPNVPFDVEIEWLVGPIPVDDFVGKEIINKVSRTYSLTEC